MAGIQDRIEQQHRIFDQCELLLLPFGHEARQGNCVIDFGQLLNALRQRSGIGHGRRQHIDGVRRRIRILHQVEQRRHGFDLGALQVQRIEVELQSRQQQQARGRDDARGHEERATASHQKPVERTERGIAHASAFSRRTQ